VAFRVGQPQGPRLEDPQIHQRHRPQIAAERDVLVGLPCHRVGKEFGLFENGGEVAAPPRQRQLQRRDRRLQAALVIRRRRRGVRLGDCQVGGRLVQASLDEVNCCVYQGQLGVIRARRKACTSAWMVCVCPSSVMLNEWSASSRAASAQSPAAWVCWMASATWPCRINQLAARRCSTGTSSGSARRSSSRSRSALPRPCQSVASPMWIGGQD
jgi:hypothetical protein